MKGHVNKSLGCLKLFVNDNEMAMIVFKSSYAKDYILKKWNAIFEGIDTKGLVYIHIFFYCFNSPSIKNIKHEY